MRRAGRVQGWWLVWLLAVTLWGCDGGSSTTEPPDDRVVRFVEESLADDGSGALPSFEEYAEGYCDAMRDFDRLALLYAALQDRLHLDPDAQVWLRRTLGNAVYLATAAARDQHPHRAELAEQDEPRRGELIAMVCGRCPEHADYTDHRSPTLTRVHAHLEHETLHCEPGAEPSGETNQPDTEAFCNALLEVSQHELISAPSLVNPTLGRRPYDRLIGHLEEAARSAPPDLVDDTQAILVYFVGVTAAIEQQDAFASMTNGHMGFEARDRVWDEFDAANPDLVATVEQAFDVIGARIPELCDVG